MICVSSMMHLCEEGNAVLCEQSLTFVTTIHDLLERLMIYRTIMLDEVREHRMSCIVNLLVSASSSTSW